ncbi:hypothetical protein CDAR_124711 [Caerostris darwini]|uniref:Maturase K n=1 Tax=Caerostris darwini TaxID=1538125 RepID=A0AAV4W3A1_9ARAC|nr:hypothetical protein CDAR_124711 [Caerostris darwini]
MDSSRITIRSFCERFIRGSLPRHVNLFAGFPCIVFQEELLFEVIIRSISLQQLRRDELLFHCLPKQGPFSLLARHIAQMTVLLKDIMAELFLFTQ